MGGDKGRKVINKMINHGGDSETTCKGKGELFKGLMGAFKMPRKRDCIVRIWEGETHLWV